MQPTAVGSPWLGLRFALVNNLFTNRWHHRHLAKPTPWQGRFAKAGAHFDWEVRATFTRSHAES